MQYLKYILALVVTTAGAVPFRENDAAIKAKRLLCKVLPIPNLQIPRGDKFIGAPVTANKLEAKPIFRPQAFNMHQDGGNTGTIDYPGPLGNNLQVSSALESLHILFWTRSGQLISGYTSIGLTGLQWGLAAVGDDLAIQATWYPPTSGQTLNVAYMELVLDTEQVVVTSKEGQIYVVQLTVAADGTPSLDLALEIDLTSVLGEGELLMNAMYDTDNNLWFSSGGLRAQGGHGDAPQNSSTIGYLPSAGTGDIHVLHVQNQMIENGIAVDGTTAYVVTGPSGLDENKVNASGYLFSFGPSSGTSVTTNWNVTYEAGDIQKPGSFSRGSGATPALLGEDFVAITDNANGRVNLVIYHQQPQIDSASQVVCKVPLFSLGESNVDIAPLAQKQGDKYGVFLLNDYNAPALYYADSIEINGDWNNLTQMAPGAIRIDVTTDGACEVAWELPDLRIQSVPLVSTNNGLLYGYTQAEEYTLGGILGPTYVWYVVALDWETGKEVWRVRAGAGGTYNDNYQPGALGPDGSFYQSVIGGFIRVQDG
ncbi:hypothetical protein H0H93_016895 [Arthromyces matolae]|nr:hypothetical protein H0H93_016895 [Arthromyces matolae]